MQPQEVIAHKKAQKSHQAIISYDQKRKPNQPQENKKKLNNQDVIKFIILRSIGNFLVLFSIYGMVLTFGPALYYEIKYRLSKFRNVQYVISQNHTITTSTSSGEISYTYPTPTIFFQSSYFGQLLGGNKVEYISPISSQFGIVIPKIGANAPIIPNVDAGKSDVYLEALKKGVAHAAGSVFPGVSGNIYLFAHSTDSFWNVGRYNAVFYLLKELINGDEIDVYYNGIRRIYRVVNKMVISPDDLQYLTLPTSYEQLTLQTCWPPGTTFKRLIILARPEADLAR